MSLWLYVEIAYCVSCPSSYLFPKYITTHARRRRDDEGEGRRGRGGDGGGGGILYVGEWRCTKQRRVAKATHTVNLIKHDSQTRISDIGTGALYCR